MKPFLLAVTLIVGLFAGVSLQAKEDKINERKEKVAAHIDKKIAMLNEFKSCVNNASKKGDIKTCQTAHKEKVSSLKEENQEMKNKK